MKKLYKIFGSLISIVFFLPGYCLAQGAQKSDVSIAINYFVQNNQVPYLKVVAKTKVDGRFQPVDAITVNLFLDKDSTGTKIGQVVTNKKGEATTLIPQSVKKEWAAAIKHTFLASFAGNNKYEASKGDLTVGKAKVLISTSGKTITATVLEMKDTAWLPVKGVELKMVVKRSAGDLPVNETPTFTTDSTGKASADFKRDNIPGGPSGIITIAAKIEDNDQYGNLSIEKTVPWGAKFTPVNTFNERTLFATRDKTPVWLLLMTYGIIIAVWGILLMLVINIIKIRKLGREV